MKLITLLKACILALIMPCLVWSESQQGIFMVSKVPEHLAFGGSTLKAFNVPDPASLEQKTATLPKGGNMPQITTNGTIIRFAVPSSLGTDVKTSFRIYNIAGELVRDLNANELLDSSISGGFNYSLDWDGNNIDGSKCISGVYLCVAEVGTEKKVVKLALLK